MVKRNSNIDEFEFMLNFWHRSRADHVAEAGAVDDALAVAAELAAQTRDVCIDDALVGAKSVGPHTAENLNPRRVCIFI